MASAPSSSSSSSNTASVVPSSLPLVSPSSGTGNNSSNGITYSNASNALIICVECGHPVAYIYKEYSPGNIRLTRCRKCRQIADKYIEYESILLFIDMLLHRLGVYRHILFNFPAHISYRPKQHKIIPSTWKILFTLLFIDSYTKLYRLRADETVTTTNNATTTTTSPSSSPSSSVTNAKDNDDYLSVPCTDNSSLPYPVNDTIEVTIDDTCLGAGVLGYEINLLHQHESYEKLMKVRELREKALRKAAFEATEHSTDWALNWKTGNILVTGKALPSSSSSSTNGTEDITTTAYAYLQAAKEWGVQQVQRLSSASGTEGEGIGSMNGSDSFTDGNVTIDPSSTFNLTSVLNPNGTSSLPLCTNSRPRIVASSPRTRRVICGICGDTGPDILSSEWSNNQTNALLTNNPTIQTFNWNIQDLRYEGPKIFFITSFEWLMYLLGIIFVLRFGNILARSRARIDSTTGSPRIPPPRSRRSLIHMESSSLSSSSSSSHTNGNGTVRTPSNGTSLPPLPPGTSNPNSLGTGSSSSSTNQGIMTNVRIATSTSSSSGGHGKISTEQDTQDTSLSRSSSRNSNNGGGSSNGNESKFNLPPLELPIVRELSETSQRSDYSSDTNTSSSNGGSLNPTGSSHHASSSSSQPALPSPSTSGNSPHGSSDQEQSSSSDPEKKRNPKDASAFPPNVVSPPVSNTSTTPVVPTSTSSVSSKPVVSSSGTHHSRTHANNNSHSQSTVPSSGTTSLSWIDTYLPFGTVLKRNIIDPSPPTIQEMKGIANALIISSFGRAFVAVTTVWVYPSSFYHAATFFAITSNIAALQAYCDCSAVEGFLMVFVGYALLLIFRAFLFSLGYIETFTVF